ncbi:MAG: hypothetical protein V4632_06710 [Pseudomonadota bacterium]
MPFADHTPRIDLVPAVTRQTFRRWGCALLLASTSLCAATALAQDRGTSADANARYQSERALCLNGLSNQDRATCLKEAGAARGEAQRGNLRDGRAAYDQNAMIRCNALPASDQEACKRRIQGEGLTKGTPAQGGVIRELVVPDNTAK